MGIETNLVALQSAGSRVVVRLGASVWAANMKVETSHHVDASEPDSHGLYEYYNEYELYRFSARGTACIACSYHDQPEEAHFLRIEVDGSSQLLTLDDMRRPLLREAFGYLQELGKRKLRWLSRRRHGYEPVLFSA